MTHKFIGTKVVTAWHQEKDGKSGMAVKYEDGYISWSPDEAFKPAYRLAEGPNQYLTFGDAIHFLKQGARVARRGWNGKGMWLSLSGPLGGRLIPHTAFWSKNNAEYAAQQVEQEGHALVLPCITMKTVDATGREAILIGWLASQTDMLSEDWVIVEGK